MRCSWATSVFTCTGLNRPTRIICAIPRASLRSVLLICCAVSKAFMCRVSTQITGRSTAVNALTSHCDSGPASIPIRPKGTPSEVRRVMISAGSVGTFCSKVTAPAASTTHTDVSFTDTSRPPKCAIASLLPRCARSRRPRSTHRHRAQPPRYTSSCVRQVMGTGFPGGTYRQVFYVADVEASGPPMDGELHVDLDEADFLAIFPLAGEDRARLIGTVRDERAEHPEALRFGDVRGRAIDHLKVRVGKVNW